MEARDSATFFLGAGGMGMAPLALYLRGLGEPVAAWDDQWQPPVRAMLAAAGVVIVAERTLPPGVGRVVRSSAVGEDDSLVREALEQGLPVSRRGELLAELAAGKRLVAVVGSHGKTTTTGMLVCALQRAGVDFGYVLGALFRKGGPAPARASKGDWLVAEVDESDGTIEAFTPEVTVLLNADWDHPDRYPSAEAFATRLGALCARTGGSVLLPPEIKELADGSVATVRTFGEIGADYLFASVSGPDGLRLQLSGAFGEGAARSVAAEGAFNAHNAAAALAAVQVMTGTVPPDALANFAGIARRQDVLLDENGRTVYADYAHHPREIAALLAHLRAKHPQAGLAVVFQPHRYSRTRSYREDFVRSLSGVDHLALLEVYAASETPQEGGAAADLAAAFPQRPDLLQGESALAAWVDAATAKPPAVLLFLGAGDIGEMATRWQAARKAAVQADWWQAACARLSAGTRVCENEPLAPKTTLRVGGPARWYAEPASEDDLAALVRAARAAGVEVFLLGRGSNLLILDAGFDGLVISLKGEAWERITLHEDGTVEAGAGVRLKRLCAETQRAGLDGFAFLEGIPGTVGGALRMNAGAMGGWMFDVVRSVRFLRNDGTVHELQREAFHTGYRHCAELREAVALSAVLAPKGRVEAHEIGRTIDVYKSKRRESQPREPSAGCMFRNPEGESAGRLVDELGLKGLREGAAVVSAVHGNFFVNEGATAADFLALVNRVRREVFARRGVVLQPEVQLVGARWEDVLEPLGQPCSCHG